jgi:hypothetical protein
MGDMKSLATKSVAEVFRCQLYLVGGIPFWEDHLVSGIFHCQFIVRYR